MIGWHVFISVPQHYNPYSGNFVWRASSPTWPTPEYNPYSANLAGCEGFGHASTLIPSYWIEVDIERLLFSLAVKMPHFWSQKIDKKVINSSTKCLISVKIAILTPHIITPPLVNVWLIFDLQKYVNWLCVFLEVIHVFKAHMSFVWIYSQLQIHTMLYVFQDQDQDTNLYWCWDSFKLEISLTLTAMTETALTLTVSITINMLWY